MHLHLLYANTPGADMWNSERGNFDNGCPSQTMSTLICVRRATLSISSVTSPRYPLCGAVQCAYL